MDKEDELRRAREYLKRTYDISNKGGFPMGPRQEPKEKFYLDGVKLNTDNTGFNEPHDITSHRGFVTLKIFCMDPATPAKDIQELMVKLLFSNYFNGSIPILN